MKKNKPYRVRERMSYTDITCVAFVGFMAFVLVVGLWGV